MDQRGSRPPGTRGHTGTPPGHPRNSAGPVIPDIALPAAPLLAYLVLWSVAATDLFVPVLPSGAMMVAAGVLAAGGRLDPLALFAAGLLGAWLGDLGGYRLGRRLHSGSGGREGTRRRLPRRAHGTVGAWERRFTRYGVLVLIISRYLPAGRTAAALSAGRMRIDARRFTCSALAAEALWAGPAVLLGYLGGDVLPPRTVPILLMAALVAAVAVPSVLLVRRFGRRTSRPRPDRDVDDDIRPAREHRRRDTPPHSPGRRTHDRTPES